jgi:two-component system, OmpR family, sensor histidine kinase TctE
VKSLKSDVYRSIIFSATITILLLMMALIAVGTQPAINPWGTLDMAGDVVTTVVDPSGELTVNDTSWRMKVLKKFNRNLWYVALSDSGKLTTFNAQPWAIDYVKLAQKNRFGDVQLAEKGDQQKLAYFRSEHHGSRKADILYGGIENSLSAAVLVGLTTWIPLTILASIPISLFMGFFASRRVMIRLNKPINELNKRLSEVDPQKSFDLLSMGNTPKELAPLLDRFNDTLALLHAANADQRQFAAELTHELRTPIAAVIARLQMLDPTHDQQAMLERLSQLHGFIGQLLDNERLRAGGKRVAEVDVVAVARKVAGDIAPLIVQANRSVELHFQEASVAIMSDQIAIARVLHNLIANAIVHGAGHVEISVSQDSKMQRVFVTVRDEGVSIKNEDIAVLLEPYKMGNGQGTGSGLGLSISRSIIEKLGGKLSGKVTDGATEFMFDLPLASI